jgi:ABC-type multidrug transport system fused ATPase/permease subunit
MNLFFNLRRSIAVLPKKDAIKISIVVIAQSFLSILDLTGVALIGLLGALTVTGVQSKPPSGALAELLSVLRLSDSPLQSQAAAVGAIAAALLIAKTILSILFTRRTFRFLSNRSALISSKLLRKLFSRSITTVTEKTSQETIYSLTQGINGIVLGVIGNSVSVISDLVLIIVLFLGLFFLDTAVAISTFVFFSSVGAILYIVLHNKASKLGEAQTRLNIESNEKIAEMVFGFREIFVRGRRDYYVEAVSDLRFRLSRFQADATFLPYIGKYVLETSVIVGVLFISAAQFALSNATDAVSTLSIFLAASTRIAPAILRVQQGGIHIKEALGASLPSLELISNLQSVPEIERNDYSIGYRLDHLGFNAFLKVESLTYRYPGASKDAISNISFEINPGEFLGIVGESGAGKSTLADLILGLINPTKGQVTISDLSPAEAISRWPGAISYVPQNSFIANTSILNNLKLGYDSSAITLDKIQQVLEITKLREFVGSLPLGLDTNIGESGSRISGGQKQRLGIARALCLNPKMMILDEATSSLDGVTEAEIASSILSLKNSVTLIVIAHRLSTVKHADKIIYLENGAIRAIGSFENLRKLIPEFDAQAKKMGL